LISTRVLPPEIEKSYSAVVDSICQISGEWFKEAATQRIHGDCHLGNVIWGREGFFMVDFDDMVIGPCVQDMWLLIPGRDEEARRQLRLMLTAYEQLRAFDQRELRLIEPLRALRLVHYAAWVARRWQDPAFPRSFPHFGSNQYWREQLADLQEILQLIQDDPYLFVR
jgi:Ser/Thr protein kinase RdoA (MazF antagonist)